MLAVLFSNSVQTVVENMLPNESYKEFSDSVSINSKMNPFNELQMSKIRKKIYWIKTKEIRVDGITMKIFKLIFEAVGDQFLQ